MRLLPFVLTGLLVLALSLSACGGAPPATTSTTTTTATTTSGQTFGSLSSAGQGVYAQSCATCHGAQGQGSTAPALIGTSASLQKYNSAQGLLNFISASMPFSAPGSLSRQQYINVLAYLLVQNQYVQASTAFNESQLSGITLTK